MLVRLPGPNSRIHFVAEDCMNKEPPTCIRLRRFSFKYQRNRQNFRPERNTYIPKVKLLYKTLLMSLFKYDHFPIWQALLQGLRRPGLYGIIIMSRTTNVNIQIGRGGRSCLLYTSDAADE